METPAFQTLASSSAGENRAANFYQWLNTRNALTLNRPLSAYEDSLPKNPMSKKGRCDFDLDYRHPGYSLARSAGLKNCSAAQHHRPQLYHHHHLINFDKSQRLQPMRRHQALRQQQQRAPEDRKDFDRFSVLTPFHKTLLEDSRASRNGEDDDDDDLGAVLRKHLTRRRRNSDASGESVTSLGARIASATIRSRKLIP